MSVPRQVLPGTRYLITRRCTQRQFWLRPSALTNQILAYCLAWAASVTGVKIHAFCAMSNHWHIVITDVDGRLPEFLHMVHLYAAKCLNASYGRWENLWASEPPSAVRLENDEDVLDKIAYTLANPVSGGLVLNGEQWPGLRTPPRAVVGGCETVERPGVFFRENGPTPKAVELKMTRPNIFPNLSDDELANLIESTVDAREASARAEMAKQQRAFGDADAILAQDPDASPRSHEPRRQLSPRVAAKNKWLRIEALQRLKTFAAAYRDAYLSFKKGAHDVVFPAGTYALRRRHGVAVAAT